MAELILMVNETEGHRFPAIAPEMKASRHHARLTRDGARYFLEDLGSSNGTFVNSKRLDGKVRLHHLDLIGVMEVSSTLAEASWQSVQELTPDEGETELTAPLPVPENTLRMNYRVRFLGTE